MTPVPNSPDAVVSPAAFSAPNVAGRLPVALKKPVMALATFCWLTLRVPPDGVNDTLILRNTSLAS